MTSDQIFASPSPSPTRKHSRRTSKKEHASKNVERGASRSRASLDRKRSRVHDEFGSQDAFVKEWGMTPEEEAAMLQEFRRTIEAEIGPLKPLFDNYYLRRFLRARQHDIELAKKMFLNHLEWRKSFGVDNIIEEFHFEERDAFLSLYPQGYHKTDRLGRPVYIQHLGQINVRALQKVTTEERMLKYHVQEYERALRYIFPACSLLAGHQISQTLAVMDLKGVSLRHLSGDVKRILSSITRTDQDNYPETLGKTLIINAPGVFRAIWALVKPMLDPRTQAKIEVCPADYYKVLTKWVDPDNIPQYLGGNSQGLLIDDIGPWSDPSIKKQIDAIRAKREESKVEGEDIEAYDHLSVKRSAEDEELNQPASVGKTSRLSTVSSTGFVSATESAAEDFFSLDEFSPSHSLSNVYPIKRSSISSTEEDERVEILGSSSRQNWPETLPQKSILARVRALESTLPTAERRLKKFAPSNSNLGKSLGSGTLLSRVEALEQAMDVLLCSQEAAISRKDVERKENKGCLPCCSIM